MKTVRCVIFALIVAVGLSGCAAEEPAPPIEGASITGGTLDQTSAGEYVHFVVPVENPGDPVGIDFRGSLTKGSLSLQVLDTADRAIWEVPINNSGPFAINTVLNPTKAGDYRLAIVWDGPIQAGYSLRWQPHQIQIPVVSPLALIAGIGMMLVAIVYGLYAIRQGGAWAYLGLGALAWCVTVALKIGFAIGANSSLHTILQDMFGKTVGTSVFNVYVGSLTGVFEVGLVWLLLRYTQIGQAAWRKVLAFGIGFGAIEALLLGIGSASSVAAGIMMASSLPFDTLEAIARANDPLYSLGPVVERIALVMVHLFSNALLFYGVAVHRKRWFWLAFVYKSAVDVVAAFAQLWGVETVAKLWAIEAIMVLFALVGWYGVRWLQRHYPTDAEYREQAAAVMSGGAHKNKFA